MNNDILNKLQEKNKEYAPEQIGDLDQLLTWILEFLDYIETPEMVRLAKLDSKAHEAHLDRKFSAFSQKNWAVFKILMERQNREENLHKILDMITRLKNVQNGKSTMDKEYETFTEGLNSEYIYPQFGGKDKFTKTIEARGKKKF